MGYKEALIVLHNEWTDFIVNSWVQIKESYLRSGEWKLIPKYSHVAKLRKDAEAFQVLLCCSGTNVDYYFTKN